MDVAVSECFGAEPMTGPVLMVYLEPAPYITAFVENVRAAWPGRIDVAYAAKDRSQPWEHELASQGEFLLPNGLAAAIRRVNSLLVSGQYQLIHLAGWGYPVLLAALVMAKLRGIPVTMETDTQRPVRNSGWKRTIKKLLYPWLLSLPNVFLPGGTRQAAYLRDYGVDDGRIRIAQMTVDVDGIRSRIAGRQAQMRSGVRERLRIPAEAICVLFLARLESFKGVEDLLEVRDIVAAKRNNVVFAVAGDGSLRGMVEAAAAGSDTLRYAGRLSGDEVLEAYCAADVFLLPSREEPWGLVINEAMAVGLPVVITDRVGCADDIVRHEETGLIVPSSPELIADAVLRLVDDALLRARLGSNGAELISKWTLRNQADRTLAVWQCVCG